MIHVNLGPRSYDIAVGGAPAGLGPFARQRCRGATAFVVADDNVKAHAEAAAAALDTLPPREYRSGLAEVVKYGVILDADFFAWLEANADAVLARDPAAVRHVVTRCCELKARIVEQDEREETGLRMVLNYGHTFAHAFEAVGGYGAWLHG